MNEIDKLLVSLDKEDKESLFAMIEIIYEKRNNQMLWSLYHLEVDSCYLDFDCKSTYFYILMHNLASLNMVKDEIKQRNNLKYHGYTLNEKGKKFVDNYFPTIKDSPPKIIEVKN